MSEKSKLEKLRRAMSLSTQNEVVSQSSNKDVAQQSYQSEINHTLRSLGKSSVGSFSLFQKSPRDEAIEMVAQGGLQMVQATIDAQVEDHRSQLGVRQAINQETRKSFKAEKLFDVDFQHATNMSERELKVIDKMNAEIERVEANESNLQLRDAKMDLVKERYMKLIEKHS